MTIISAITPPPVSTFRDMGDAISPSWLNGPVGQRYRYAMAVLYDALADGAGYAVRSRFPLLAPPDAFSYLQSDRQIDQGFSESQASFANRLVQWLDLWREAGNAGAVLLAVLGLFLPTSVRVRTVDDSSNWNTYLAGAVPFPIGADSPTPPTLVQQAANWNWDGTSQWWRAWVIIYANPLGWSGSPLWGTGNWGDVGRLWGITGPTSQMLATLRAVIKKWKPQHTTVTNIIISFDDTLFDPALGPDGTHNPNGTWGNPANRPANAVFLDGVT